MYLGCIIISITTTLQSVLILMSQKLYQGGYVFIRVVPASEERCFRAG